MKKVLLYPGAFNPPHYGHAAAIEVALKQGNFQEVWVMPSGKREDKNIDTSYEDRRALGELFAEYLNTKLGFPVKLITAELDNTDGKFTHEILREIKSQDGVEITQLIGMDGFVHLLPKLNDPNEKLIVIERPNYALPNGFVAGANIQLVQEDVGDISSTKIRNLAELHDPEFKKLVPEKIADYIETRSLYSGNTPLKEGKSQSLEMCKEYLGKKVELVIDQPYGTYYKNAFYTENYGNIPGTLAPDGCELDAYFVGPKEPLEKAEGIVIAIIHRLDDDDDKLIVVPEGVSMTDEEIDAAVNFREKFFKHEIVR